MDEWQLSGILGLWIGQEFRAAAVKTQQDFFQAMGRLPEHILETFDLPCVHAHEDPHLHRRRRRSNLQGACGGRSVSRELANKFVSQYSIKGKRLLQECS